MDAYVPLFQAQGASLVMLAKGNRTQRVTDACGSTAGFTWDPSAALRPGSGKECITGVEVLGFPELGMEAVFRITVRDFPAFIIVDDKGNDFFETLWSKEGFEGED